MSNKYVYHIVPEQVVGDTLYPLSQIKGVYPEEYKKLMGKYEGRDRLLAMRIPQFNCTWADVLHMAAVHPNNMVKALAKAGISKSFRYYEIDPEMLDEENLLIFTNPKRDGERIYDLLDEYFIKFNANELDKWTYIPDETIQHYRDRTAEGKHILIFFMIPHVLYKGNIDIKGLTLKETSSIPSEDK